MTIKEIYRKRREANEQRVFDYWQEHGQNVKATAEAFGYTRARIYQIINKRLAKNK